MFTIFDVKLLTAILDTLQQVSHCPDTVSHRDIVTCVDSVEEFREKVILFLEKEKTKCV